MIEQSDGTYVESEDSVWPKDGYKFNEELSGCIDSEGNTLENLLTYTNGTITLKTKSQTSCYIYFDFIFYGNGTEEEPYLIQNIEDLVELSSAVNIGMTFSGKYFSLTKTLDFNNEGSYNDSSTTKYGDINNNGVVEELLIELTTEDGFTPIGVAKSTDINGYFSGNFNGNENKIENIHIHNLKYEKIGLFGFIKNGTIANLGVSGNIKTDLTADVGGLIGNAHDSSIINSYNEANVYSSLGSYNVGGLVGAMSGTIEDSYNMGTISNGNGTGGLVGGHFGYLTIKNSYNKGKVVKEYCLGYHLGGLVGRDAVGYETTIINSYNIGEIDFTTCELGTNNIGGIIGRVEGIFKADNIYNEANILIDPVVNDVETHAVNIGGIVGYERNNASVSITNSYNKGNMANGFRIGGIIGYFTTGSMTLIDVHNYGSISSENLGSNRTTAAGGLVGYLNSSIAIVLNSSNQGEIYSIKNAGGIIGFENGQSEFILSNSYNSGNISGGNANAIVLVPNDDETNNIKNSINMNNVYNLGLTNGSISSHSLAYIGCEDYKLENVYSITTGTNLDEDPTTILSEEEIKSETFVETLNSNIENTNIEDIDIRLKDYKFSTWKLGINNYPVFNYQD